MDPKRIVFVRDAKFNLIADPAGGPGTLEGYAMVWNVKSTDRGGYKVMLAPGSAKFDDSTFALWNHDFSNPVAGTTNGTLSIACDNFGAKVTMKLANTQLGKDVAENVRSGLVKGMSFSMLMAGVKFSTATDPDGDEVDTFTAFDCDEVTITPIPAFPQTTIGVAGASPYAEAARREQFSKAQKEQDTDQAKLDQYRMSLYPTALAESQQGG